jgi:hypothetical protein
LAWDWEIGLWDWEIGLWDWEIGLWDWEIGLWDWEIGLWEKVSSSSTKHIVIARFYPLNQPFFLTLQVPKPIL